MTFVTATNLVIVIAVLIAALSSAFVEPFLNNPLARRLSFRLYRFVVWVCIGISYSAVYFGRYNLIVLNVEEIREAKLGMDATDFGWIVTSGYLSYTIFMLVNGYVVDKSSSHLSTFLFIGVAGSGIVNLLVGVLLSYPSFKDFYFWGILVGTVVNYYFQAFATSVFVKVNGMWFHYRERGTFGGLFSVITLSGYFLSLALGSLVVTQLPVEWDFYIPAFLLLFMTAMNFLLVKPSPADAGYFTEDEENKQFAAHNKDEARNKVLEKVSITELLRWMFTSPRILMIMLVFGEIKEGVLVWFSSYVETVGVPQSSFLYLCLSTGIFFGGVVGSVLCGWISDRFFHSKREPALLIFHAIQFLCLLVLFLWDEEMGGTGVVVDLIVVAMTIFGIYGMLNFAEIVDMAGPSYAATVAAIFTGISYICSSLAGAGMGWAIQHYGFVPWKGTLMVTGGIGLLAMGILSLPIWQQQQTQHNATTKRKTSLDGKSPPGSREMKCVLKSTSSPEINQKGKKEDELQLLLVKPEKQTSSYVCENV